jgi:small-conductance mechanosensitive channel
MIRWLKVAVYSLALLILYLVRDSYTSITANIHLPDRFEHTLYRILVAIFIIEIIRQVVIIAYKPQDPKRKRDNFTAGISHLATVVYVLLIIALLISLLNVSMKEAIQSISLVAAAVVLMTKDYISNVINGMYLTFAKVINIGDQVMIDGSKGKILDITLTNVHLLNDDDDIVYVPNNKVFASEIINYTRRELKKSSIDFEVEPYLVHDVEELEKELIRRLAPYAAYIQPGTYNLKTVSVKKYCIQFKFQYILHEPLNKEVDKKVRRHFIRELVKWMNEGE